MMIRSLAGWGILWALAIPVQADDAKLVSITVTIASGSDAKLALTEDAATLAKTVQALDEKQQLTYLSRIRLNAIENQEAQFQFGETTSVIAGRTFGFGSSGRGGPGQPERPGPQSVANYQMQQTGTMVIATPRVVDSGVLVQLSIEQSRFDPAKAPAEEQASAPPPKPVVTIKSAVLIPKDGPALLGGFDRSTGGVIERTVVLVTATVAGVIGEMPQGKATATNLRIFRLHHTESEQLAATLANLFPKRDFSLASDSRSNSLLAQGTVEDLSTLQELIARLDQSPQKASK